MISTRNKSNKHEGVDRQVSVCVCVCRPAAHFDKGTFTEACVLVLEISSHVCTGRESQLHCLLQASFLCFGQAQAFEHRSAELAEDSCCEPRVSGIPKSKFTV